MENRTYRKLTAYDLQSVIGMNENFRKGFIRFDNAVEFLENPKNWLFACLQDDVIVGFAYGYELSRLDDGGDMLYIHEVGVIPAYQRRGIGYALMCSLKEKCREQGLSRIFLRAPQSNTAANALFRKAGGQTSDETGGTDVCYFFQIPS